MTICLLEAGNISRGQLVSGQHYRPWMNKSPYHPRTRVTIVLLYRILTNATALAAMTSPEDNITYEGNIARKPERILPCT